MLHLRERAVRVKGRRGHPARMALAARHRLTCVYSPHRDLCVSKLRKRTDQIVFATSDDILAIRAPRDACQGGKIGRRSEHDAPVARMHDGEPARTACHRHQCAIGRVDNGGNGPLLVTTSPRRRRHPLSGLIPCVFGLCGPCGVLTLLLCPSASSHSNTTVPLSTLSYYLIIPGLACDISSKQQCPIPPTHHVLGKQPRCRRVGCRVLGRQHHQSASLVRQNALGACEQQRHAGDMMVKSQPRPCMAGGPTPGLDRHWQCALCCTAAQTRPRSRRERRPPRSAPCPSHGRSTGHSHVDKAQRVNVMRLMNDSG